MKTFSEGECAAARSKKAEILLTHQRCLDQPSTSHRFARMTRIKKNPRQQWVVSQFEFSSLCNLSVLCVSVVNFAEKSHYRDTENTEVAQRSPKTKTLLISENLWLVLSWS